MGAQVNPSDLKLWEKSFEIRKLVEDWSFSFGHTPLGTKEEYTLISAVEQIFQTEGILLSFKRMAHLECSFARECTKWGAIQALFVQQDAVRALTKLLGAHAFDIYSNPRLLEIRDDLRNQMVGHPVSNKPGRPMIVTAYSEPDEATFIEMDEGHFEIRTFGLTAAIDDQQDIFQKVVEELFTELEAKEAEFRETMKKTDPLAPVRNNYISYLLGNLDPDLPKMPHMNAKEVRELIADFRKAFQAVGRSKVVEHDLKRMEYAIDSLIAYFSPSEDSHLRESDIPVFLDVLSYKNRRLREYVTQIDDELRE